MSSGRAGAALSRWELAAETIAVKIRWFGLLFGYVLVNFGEQGEAHRGILNAILALGTAYTLLDTYYSIRGRVFLGRYPLFISLMETVFIGLLCYYDGGLDSSFRYYYFLSLICCAMRYTSRVTYAACALHCASYSLLYLALPAEQRRPAALVLMLVSGLPTSWAMPAASRPKAAIFSWCRTWAWACCSSRVRSAMRASSWA